MHLVYTTIDMAGRGQLHVTRSRDVRDLLAAAIYTTNDALLCRPDGHCLLNPPAWTYWLGGHHRYSLGGLLWHIGQWSAGRYFSMIELSSHGLDHRQLIEDYGWRPEDLDD